jgi:hypothetical protein
VPERSDAMPDCGRLRLPMRFLGMLEGLPRMLRSGQVFLFPLLLGYPMGVGGFVVQFGSSLMVLVMGSVVITGGHNLKTHYLPRLCVGFLGQLVSAIRVLQCSFRMPISSFVIALFIMFGGGPMGVRREFVLLGGFPVCVVHWAFLLESFYLARSEPNHSRNAKLLSSLR